MMFKPLTPRMRQIPPRRSAVLSVVDVGASKVVCLIARLTPMERAETLRGRTHRCKVLGLGHQRSRGVKAGAIVDLDAAESAIRLAIDAAERMAGAEVQSVIVNMSGGRLSSQLLAAKIAVHGKAVSDYEVHRVIEAASAASAQPGRAVLHAIASGFRLDVAERRPRPERHGRRRTWRGACRRLLRRGGGAQPDARRRTLPPQGRGDGRLALCRQAFPRWSTTRPSSARRWSISAAARPRSAVFVGDRLAHVDAIAVGGNHMTMDVARGLSVSLADAERLKTLYGACIASPSDDRETIAVHRAGDDIGSCRAICRSRISCASSARGSKRFSNWCATGSRTPAMPPLVGRRLVLTGGASQLTGLPELARDNRLAASPARPPARRRGAAGIGQVSGVRRPRSG